MRSPACPAVALRSASASSTTVCRSSISWSAEACVNSAAVTLRFLAISTPGVSPLTPQNLEKFLQFQPKLLDDLLTLADIAAGFLARQLVAGAADRESLIIQEAADLADNDYVLALIIAAIAAPLDRLELRELLLPIAQHMRLDPAQIADLTDGEVALAGNRRQLIIILWLQHMLQLVP